MIIIKKVFKIYILILILFTIYLLLDTFVITRKYEQVEISNSINNSKKIISNDNSYSDDNININISTYEEYNTTIYVADIILKNSDLLKTAFADNTYGKNVTEKTSVISENVNAILSINGDYYGVQNSGYVLRNGIIYRNISSGKDALVIYKDGSFEIINENDISLEELLEKGAYNVLSFGPALINNGSVTVSETDEVGKAMASNPRTAIGIIDENHYVFVVSDGRTNESEGLSLYELASFMSKFNVKTLYNLDGGGSSTMYFNGTVINNPTTNGKISERKVSDIVYVGY